jgi:ribosomal protein S18 acetylase RimI-like enzyme
MIRKANVSEIEKIITITRACGRKMASEGIFQWNDHYPNSQAFKQDIERAELYVLLSENTPVGCIAISSLKDEVYSDVNWLTPDGTNYYIHRLAVHPNFQGQGNARILMDFAEDLAREKNATSIRLDTFSKNHRNQRFYEARGYTRLGSVYFPKQSEYPFYCYELVL